MFLSSNVQFKLEGLPYDQMFIISILNCDMHVKKSDFMQISKRVCKQNFTMRTLWLKLKPLALGGASLLEVLTTHRLLCQSTDKD